MSDKSKPKTVKPSAIFGARLRAARRSRVTPNGRPMSLEHVVEAMARAKRATSLASLARLERGQRDPTLDEALALAWWFNASPTAWLTPSDDEELAVTEHDSLPADAAQVWLRFGLGSAERWEAQLTAELPFLVERDARAYLRALKAKNGVDMEAAARSLVSTVTAFLKAHRQFVDEPKRAYGWDGLPIVRES